MNKTIAQQLNITKFPFNIKDEKDNEVYFENSNSYWIKYQYDEKGNEVYFEDSYGCWVKRQYDEKGNRIYYEDSYGCWAKRHFDEKGNEVYYEDSTGKIIDKRPKQTVEITLDEIAKALNIPVNQLKIKK